MYNAPTHALVSPLVLISPDVYLCIRIPTCATHTVCMNSLCEGTLQYLAYRALLQLFERLAVEEHTKNRFRIVQILQSDDYTQYSNDSQATYRWFSSVRNKKLNSFLHTRQII